jgi:protein-L-isoaspartate(D-aspartate) O-methyltransferase
MAPVGVSVRPMDSSGAEALRHGLVEHLRAQGLRSEPVAEAFARVPREAFVPDVASRDGLEAVYRDEAIAAKVDQFGRWLSSSSQPWIMAAMLEQLDVRSGQRVLEVGAVPATTLRCCASSSAPTAR